MIALAGEPALDDSIVRLSRPIALLADGATEPPRELLLLAAGFIETTKGTFKCTSVSCESVMTSHAELGRDYPFDYEHASLGAMFAADPAEAGKAAGWFKPLARDGAIWAVDCQWTPRAREKILAREFRYISPAFRASEEGEVLELRSCALTNDPATKKPAPILNNRGAAAGTSPDGDKEKHVNFLQLLAARLGLPTTASETEVVTALARTQDEATAQRGVVAQLFALTAKNSAADAMGVVQGWKAGSDQVAALSAKLADVEKKAGEREIEELIGEAKKDGRLGAAAEKAARDVALSGGVSALRSMLSVLPKHGKPAGDPDPKGITVALSAEELEVAKQMGVDPAKLAETKAKKLTAAA